MSGLARFREDPILVLRPRGLSLPKRLARPGRENSHVLHRCGVNQVPRTERSGRDQPGRGECYPAVVVGLLGRRGPVVNARKLLRVAIEEVHLAARVTP